VFGAIRLMTVLILGIQAIGVPRPLRFMAMGGVESALFVVIIAF